MFLNGLQKFQQIGNEIECSINKVYSILHHFNKDLLYFNMLETVLLQAQHNN